MKVLLTMQLFLLWWFTIIHTVNMWQSPGFYPNDDVGEEVEFQEPSDEPAIYLNENVEGDITIAFLNYKGEDPPRVTKFFEPSSSAGSNLGVLFSRTANEDWQLVITVSQNYENIGKYTFEIFANGIPRRVYLYIRNLDDEDPFIETVPSNNPCVIKENYSGQTQCFFTIRDADGIMDDVVIYTIENSVIGDDIHNWFEIKTEGEVQNGLQTWRAELEVKQELDYEKTTNYLLDITVTDSGGHVSNKERLIVQVDDLPDTEPVWTSVPSYISILEGDTYTFRVQAIDGDFGIAAIINYEITSRPDERDFFNVDKDTGDLKVGPISRDETKKEIFTFTIRAFEKDDEASETKQNVTVVVEDINNNSPKIYINESSITIPENKTTTLSIDISIEDIDLGEAATFTVSLAESEYSSAFQIVPNRGYQNANFVISVIDSSKLDFENPDWKEFDLVVQAVEVLDTTHGDTKTIHIKLTDWNDEPPVFDREVWEVDIFEDIKQNMPVATMVAHDRDELDVIRYNLLGSASKTFTIGSDGKISTKVEKALDFERMDTVVIQVEATDTYEEPYHKAVAQLTINVKDVNDEQPLINVGTTQITILENKPINEKISTEITATDDDTESELEFSINWDKSRAVKNGQTVPADNYTGCLDVETDTNVQTNLSTASFVVAREIDYELWDTMYIIVVVTDNNQTTGTNSNEVQIAISILDENDNEPVFLDSSISKKKSVRENATAFEIIGAVIAEDKDDVSKDKLTYSIKPLDENTPTNWIAIDNVLGEIYVKDSYQIDADIPLSEIKYIVKVSDTKHETDRTITIEIIDTNNKKPNCEINEDLHIPESSPTGTQIPIIKQCTDGDRDEEYKTPWFRINSLAAPEVKRSFSIDTETGVLQVISADPENDLDRDEGRVSFEIPFIVSDNYYQNNSMGQNPVEYSITLYLDDINDNSPIILPNQSLEGNENMESDIPIGSIFATDKDEKGSVNSKLTFQILNIRKQPGGGTDPTMDMFRIETKDPDIAEAVLYSGHRLETYYGDYIVKIKVSDTAESPNSSEDEIKVTLNRFNFKAPIFVYPHDSDIIYLAKPPGLNKPLITSENEVLRSFEVSDQQKEKWSMLISIDPDTNPDDAFYFYPLPNNKADLILRTMPTLEGTIYLKIIGDCQCQGQGDGPFRTEVKIGIRFIDNDSEPTFSEPSSKVSFKENANGVFQLPKAFFNEEGEDWDRFTPYYFLQTNGVVEEYFEIGKETALLTVVKPLDRELISAFELKVTTSKDSGGNSSAAPESVLSVSVTVLDENDEHPEFLQQLYYNGVKPSDNLRTVILTFQAKDRDSEDKLDFSINGDIKAVGEGIEQLNNPFSLSPSNSQSEESTLANADLLLDFSVQSNMKGYFEFTVRVTDQADHFNDTTVKIYVVSDQSRTTFKFENNVTTVINQADTVKETFEDVLQYICNVEAIVQSTNAGTPVDGQTDVIAHFVNPETNEAIGSDVIRQKTSNAEVFSTIRSRLLEGGLYLMYAEDGQPVDDNVDQLKAWLIAVSAVLGTLCVALIIGFVVKTRSLLKRLKKLSVPQDNIEPTGKIGPAPTTNKKAMLGSNPIYREEKKAPDMDNSSIRSRDSYLIGAEDNIIFDYDIDLVKSKSKEEDC